MSQSLKIATWNMSYWSKSKLHDESWNYLLNEIDADILLVQEARPDKDLLDNSKLIWTEIGGNRNWGSGVYSKNYPIKEIKFENNFIGSVVASEVEIAPKNKLIFISLYALMKKINGQGNSIANLHGIFSDLTELLGNKEYKGRIIVGGDFNASSQFDEIQAGNSHKIFFERVKDLGLHNCYEGFYNEPVRTLRHNSNTPKPWQIDYFFISKQLKENLSDCKVIENEKIKELSDHNPVKIELLF